MSINFINNRHDARSLILDSWNSDDVPELARLAVLNDQALWAPTPGAQGVVVRDEEVLRGFCLLRETPHGFVVDELWHDKTRRGVAALGMLARWIEDTIQRISDERKATIQLGGIVRHDNPVHQRALEHRGYIPVATVLSKEFKPNDFTALKSIQTR